MIPNFGGHQLAQICWALHTLSCTPENEWEYSISECGDIINFMVSAGGSYIILLVAIFTSYNLVNLVYLLGCAHEQGVK